MASTFRHLLACLLLLALPLQGYAAATMLLCGQGHHGDPAKRDVSAHAMHDLTQSHGPQRVSHHGASPVVQTQTNAAPENALGKDALGTLHPNQHSKHQDDNKPASCSACSVCCNLLVMLPSGSLLESAPHLISASPFQNTDWAAPFLKGPRRPPRLLLA